MPYVTSSQYLEAQEDVRIAGADALQHALGNVINGNHEPRCLFIPDDLATDEGKKKYLDYWEDVAAAGYTMDTVLTHYMQYGWKEPRWPVPGSFVAPTTPGMHDIGTIPGPFFMSGLRVPSGLLLGTYRTAKLYLFNGSFRVLLSLPTESVYMIYGPTSDGGYLFSTECPAQVWKCSDDQFDDWKCVFSRPEAESLAFDILPLDNGLCLFTVDKVNSHNIRIYKGDINGNSWSINKDYQGHFKQCCTDGARLYLVGEKDGFPYVVNRDGQQILLDKGYVGQEINYAVAKDNILTLGMNNIEDFIVSDGTRRNGYINYLENGNDISGIDLKAPWIMNIKIDPVTRYRYAIASIWRESGYPLPELAMSKDGRKWSKIADIPMPSVQTIEIADGGIWCYGGKYGEFGKVCFYKF
jgi:hypothetical protein